MLAWKRGHPPVQGWPARIQPARRLEPLARCAQPYTSARPTGLGHPRPDDSREGLREKSWRSFAKAPGPKARGMATCSMRSPAAGRTTPAKGSISRECSIRRKTGTGVRRDIHEPPVIKALPLTWSEDRFLRIPRRPRTKDRSWWISRAASARSSPTRPGAPRVPDESCQSTVNGAPGQRAGVCRAHTACAEGVAIHINDSTFLLGNVERWPTFCRMPAIGQAATAKSDLTEAMVQR